MTLIDDLHAAKALLVAGDPVNVHGAIFGAVNDGGGKRGPRYEAAFKAVVSANYGMVSNLINRIKTSDHLQEVIGAIDRAISVAETSAS